MIISILLENKGGNVVERTSKKDNADYLAKGEDNPDFPYLSLVESYDYSTFDWEEMDAIIAELLQVKRELQNPEDLAHIDDIIRLCHKCKENKDTCLTFAG